MSGVGTAPVGCLELAPVIVLSADATLADVAGTLARHQVPAVVVRGDPPTLLTPHHVVEAIAGGAELTTPVAELMVHEPRCVRESTTVADAVMAMLEHGDRVVMVLDDASRPVGLLALAPAVTALLSEPPWLGGLRLALHLEHRVTR